MATMTYWNLTGKRKLKDYWDGEDEIGIDRVFNLLALVDHEVAESVIESWTENQRRYVANWALRVYLKASDNGTELIQKPDWLTDQKAGE